MLHIEMTVLRDLLRMGLLRPWDGSPEGRSQRQLFIDAACDLAIRFLDAGYGVVIDDVVTPEELPFYRDRLHGIERAHFFVLLPDEETLQRRAGSSPRNRERLSALHGRLSAWDGSTVVTPEALSADLVADRVMALAGEGKALLTDVSGV